MELHFPIILDGATGTELQKRGFKGDMSTEEWVLLHPEVIQEVQRGYIEAGSNIIYAPTFSANRRKLEERKLFNQTEEMNRRLVAISKEVAEGKAYVAGDMAPSGAFLAPLGEVSFEELVDIYTEQAAGLEAAGVDLFVIETMMSLPDARAAVLAVRSVSEKPIIVSFTCDEKGKSLTGTDIAAAMTVLEGMGISAFGLNCSAGPDTMLQNLQRLRPHARIPLLAKPNAGMPEIIDGEAIYDCPPEKFVTYMQDMAAAGVALFGGCCGTHKGHIGALKEALQGFTFTKPAPQYADMLPTATEKQVFYIKPGTTHGPVLHCGAELEETLSDAMDGDDELVAVLIESWDDVQSFADVQFMVRKPLCMVCENAELLEAALRAYQGRAVYEGGLKEAELAPLREKYGLLT